MLCDYSTDDLTCRACGHKALRFPTYRECTATQIALPRPMLGDALASLLTNVGITESRVSAWLGGAECGCASRRKWMNRAGALTVDRIERVMNRLSRFAFGA